MHREFLPEFQTINKEYYWDVMKRLRDEIGLKRPDVWGLQHDNTAIIIRNLLTKCKKYDPTATEVT